MTDRTSTRLLPVALWTRFHPWPSAAGLRWYVFNANENGANAWIRRVGRRVLIDEAAFFAWVKERSGGGSRE